MNQVAEAVVLLIFRTIRIFALTAVFVPAFLLRKLAGPHSGPRLLRWFLQSCGGAFVKLGQVIAMRYDLVPAEYSEELSKLLDRLPQIHVSRIIQVIEDDLGRTITECFSKFEPAALASASIAQVHGAALLNGESVVVKVLRPGNRERFAIDLKYLTVAGHVMDHLAYSSRAGASRIIGEIVELTREELDFRREARNIDLMHARMRRDEVAHYAPRVHPPLCGPSVITMERIVGVPVTAMIAALEAGDENQLRAWADAGISPRRTARILMRSILEQTMRHHLFHADPHAANLIVMTDGTLAWVDFGMLGWLDERLWALQFKMREAVASGKIHAAYQHFVATLEPIPPVDLSSFEAKIKGFMRDWIGSSESPLSSIQEKSSGYFFLRVFDAIRQAKLRLPLGLMRLYRTIIVGDIVMLKLDPQIDWLPVLREFIADEQHRRTLLICGEVFSADTIRSLVEASVAAPRAALTTFDWIQNGLPEQTRYYRRWLSTSERIARVAIEYSRLTIGAAILILMGSRFIAPWFFPDGSWARFGQLPEPWWEMLIVAGLLGILFLGRIMRELDERG